MRIYDLIASAQSGEAIPNLAREVGLTPEETERAIRAVLPELAGAVERNTLSRGGLADLIAAMGDGHHEALLEHPDAIGHPQVIADGNAILGHLLGSKDKSRAVAARASYAAGIPDSIIKMLLPILAQWLMGAIAKGARGGLGDILSKLPGAGGGAPAEAPRPGRPPGDGGGFELPRAERPQGGFPLPPIGTDAGADGAGSRGRDRSATDPASDDYDVPAERPQGRSGLPRSPRPQGGFPLPPIGTDAGRDDASGAGREGGFGLPRSGGAPLPMPGGNGQPPWGDLSDILRKKGSIEGAPGGGALGGIVRNVLGSLLGFEGRGVMGWFLRLIFLRLGWGLIKRIFGRVLLGR